MRRVQGRSAVATRDGSGLLEASDYGVSGRVCIRVVRHGQCRVTVGCADTHCGWADRRSLRKSYLAQRGSTGPMAEQCQRWLRGELGKLSGSCRFVNSVTGPMGPCSMMPLGASSPVLPLVRTGEGLRALRGGLRAPPREASSAERLRGGVCPRQAHRGPVRELRLAPQKGVAQNALNFTVFQCTGCGFGGGRATVRRIRTPRVGSRKARTP